MFLLLPFIFLVQMIQIYEGFNNAHNHKLTKNLPHLGPLMAKNGFGGTKKLDFEQIKEIIAHKVKEKKKEWLGKGRGKNRKWKDKKAKVSKGNCATL